MKRMDGLFLFIQVFSHCQEQYSHSDVVPAIANYLHKPASSIHINSGDHSPQHVHVYKRSKMVLKWDLENGLPIKGKAPLLKL